MTRYRSFGVLLLLLLLMVVATITTIPTATLAEEASESLEVDLATLIRGKLASSTHDKTLTGLLGDGDDDDVDPGSPISIDLSFNSSSNNVTSPIAAWNRLPSWTQYLLATIFLIAGVIVTFFGWRFLHLSIFLIGGFVFAILTFGILAASIPNSISAKSDIVWGTSSAVWIVAGLILTCFLNFAIFVLGFGLGAVVSLALEPVALKFVWPDNPVANTFIWVCIFGILGGVMMLCLKKPLTIITTAACGAFALVVAFGVYIGSYNTVNEQVDATVSPTDLAYFFSWMGVALLGCGIQFCYTAKMSPREWFEEVLEKE